MPNDKKDEDEESQEDRDFRLGVAAILADAAKEIADDE